MLKIKKHKLLSLLIVIIVIAALSVIYNKTTQKTEVTINGIIPAKTQEELILDSDLILTGSVKDILDSRWSNENFVRGKEIRNILQTDIIIEANEVLSGELINKTVTVRIDKGEDDTTIVHSDGYPDFTIGEKVLLFLSRDDSDVATDEDYYVLTGMLQGKYNLSNNSRTTLKENETSVYTNGKDDTTTDNLKQQIVNVKEESPNYKAEKKARQIETEQKNKQLFGE